MSPINWNGTIQAIDITLSSDLEFQDMIDFTALGPDIELNGRLQILNTTNPEHEIIRALLNMVFSQYIQTATYQFAEYRQNGYHVH